MPARGRLTVALVRNSLMMNSVGHLSSLGYRLLRVSEKHLSKSCATFIVPLALWLLSCTSSLWSLDIDQISGRQMCSPVTWMPLALCCSMSFRGDGASGSLSQRAARALGARPGCPPSVPGPRRRGRRLSQNLPWHFLLKQLFLQLLCLLLWVLFCPFSS